MRIGINLFQTLINIDASIAHKFEIFLMASRMVNPFQQVPSSHRPHPLEGSMAAHVL